MKLIKKKYLAKLDKKIREIIETEDGNLFKDVGFGCWEELNELEIRMALGRPGL